VGKPSHISAEYSELLEKVCADHGISFGELMSAPGMSRAAAYRALKNARSPTVAVAEQARAAIMRLRPGVFVPPPIVHISNGDQYIWAKSGQILQSLDPAMFRDLLAVVQGRASDLELAEKRKAESIAAIGSLLKPEK